MEKKFLMIVGLAAAVIGVAIVLDRIAQIIGPPSPPGPGKRTAVPDRTSF